MKCELKNIVNPLLDWYAKHKRDLPWRDNVTPYRVWISEIMLQQTRVEAVRGYFQRFIERFPTVQALAAATEEELMKYWEGLGYYSRARNILKTAKIIAFERAGEFPSDYAQLLALPGIGAYTAGAISSIAFGNPTPAVDGNVLRVYARLFADDRDVLTESVKKDVSQKLQAVYPTGKNAAAFTQSLMELGATVCVPNGAPKCGECPLSAICLSHARGEEVSRPKRKEKAPRKLYNLTVFLLKAGNLIAVEKRTEKGVLNGQYAFPSAYGEMKVEEGASHLETLGATNITALYERRETHIFTHVEWQMKAIAYRVEKPFGPYLWADERQITEEIALPSAFRKFFPF